HPRRYILDRFEHVEFEIEALPLFGRCPGAKAVAHVVFRRRAELLQIVGSDVVVRNQQSVFADETPRAPRIKPDGGFLQMVQPGVAGVELVAFFQDLARGLVKEPHTFIGSGDETGPGDTYGEEGALVWHFVVRGSGIEYQS